MGNGSPGQNYTNLTIPGLTYSQKDKGMAGPEEDMRLPIGCGDM